MTDDEKRVADLIHTAFRGVRLGNGVGLRQGRGLDDCADAATLAEYRSKDEKDDWEKISWQDLNHYGDSLSFFDGAGMRFHLPAFVLAELAGTLTAELLFHLTGYFDRFDLLSQSQRHAMREYLQLRLTRAWDENNDFVYPMIEKALAEYWSH